MALARLRLCPANVAVPLFPCRQAERVLQAVLRHAGSATAAAAGGSAAARVSTAALEAFLLEQYEHDPAPLRRLERTLLQIPVGSRVVRACNNFVTWESCFWSPG